MALSSSFRDRLEHMERTRNQCLSRLQLEKELQEEKSNLLSTKLTTVRSTEQSVLQSEIEDMEDLSKDKERLYQLNEVRMKEFRHEIERCVVDYRINVDGLKKRLDEVKSSFQGNNGDSSNAEIAAAELRKAQLLAVKQNVDRSLASNYYMRAQLLNQLQRSKAHKAAINNIE
ncbi:hypothetical protein ACFE04_013239 [Oxalis oulophora]